MPDENSKSWTLLKGIGGIASAVITALLIYYFTHPSPPPITFEGLVSNVTSHDPVANANVSISIGPIRAHQKTDMEGRYEIKMNATGNSTDMGDVTVEATGYEPYSNTVALTSGENFAEIPIDAIPPHVNGKPTPPRIPILKPIILKTPPAGYISKKEIAYPENFKK